MIAIIDYNAGNIASVANAMERFGVDYIITKDPKTILTANKVIFPGQGRAKPAMEELKKLGLDEVIKTIKVPFLGICLGMQLLFRFSEEDNTKCLELISGKVVRFSEPGLKVPQIGWNTVTQTQCHGLFENVPDTFFAYFVNSFYVKTQNQFVLGRSTYGSTACATVVRKDNFYGTQFHPEKSGPIGLGLLKNFCELGKTKKIQTTVIPAIDIIGGKCARLYQGDYKKQTSYNNNPLAVARSFADEGASYLHVIDLDGAKQGEPKNAGLIIKIAQATGIPVETGGGIRTLEQARKYLDAGIERIIVSTSALVNPRMLKDIILEYGAGRIVVSVDAKDGIIAIKGWQETVAEGVESLLKKLTALGVTTIIYTDIKKDGTLNGPNFSAIKKILSKPFKIIIAGGGDYSKKRAKNCLYGWLRRNCRQSFV